jgi:hypothetical protein
MFQVAISFKAVLRCAHLIFLNILSVIESVW